MPAQSAFACGFENISVANLHYGYLPYPHSGDTLALLFER